MASITTTTEVLDKHIEELKEKNENLQFQIWAVEEQIKNVFGIKLQSKNSIEYKKKILEEQINKRIELMNILREYDNLLSSASNTIDDLMTEHDYVEFAEQEGHKKILSSIE